MRKVKIGWVGQFLTLLIESNLHKETPIIHLFQKSIDSISYIIETQKYCIFEYIGTI
jgi:hypothetical protein